MGKKFVLGSIATLAFLIAGCGQSASVSVNSSMTSQAAPAAPLSQPVGVTSSIKDAMGLGTAMQCTYTMNNGQGNASFTTFIQGKQYRSESTIAGKKTISIFDGSDTAYVWTDGQKTGFKIQLSCMKDLASALPSGTPSVQVGDDAFSNAANVSCQPTGSIDFTVPSDITFQDQCAMLKATLKNIPSMPSGSGY